MTKLRLKKQKFWNGKINVPIDGEITVDENGIVEVSDEAGEILAKITSEYAAIDENIQPKKKRTPFDDDEIEDKIKPEKTVKKSEKGKPAVKAKKDKSAPTEALGIDLESLAELPEEDLIEIARQAGIEGYEKFTGKSSTKALVNFIKLKLKNK